MQAREIDTLKMFRSPYGETNKPRMFPQEAIDLLKENGISMFDTQPNDIDGIDLGYFSIHYVSSDIVEKFIAICKEYGLSLRGGEYGLSPNERIEFEAE